MSGGKHPVDVAVVGSGFAGSITARVLARQGWRVALLERSHHPRFALGESSTPLAAISLETLAAEYGLKDLHALAAYGRWMGHLPHLRRGLKRGFTFFQHQAGRAFSQGTTPGDPPGRLLVAASPDGAVADSHWLRQDVDAFLARQAAQEGVELREGVNLESCEESSEGLILRGNSPEGPLEIAARFVVDASGAGAFLAGQLGIAAAEPAVDTALVFGHFSGVKDFAQVVAEEGLELPPGPYPDDRAAVHHLLGADGWMYVLPFDHEVASAGFVLRREGPAFRELGPSPEGAEPEPLFRRLAARYPSIERQFAEAQPQLPVGFTPRVGHRLTRAAGRRWLLLPSTYAFTDPLFSTGIAWSLAGVERVGALFGGGTLPSEEGLERYGSLLEAEANHIDRLIQGAYRAMESFPRAASWSLFYFAAASFHEALRRLAPEARPWPWEGFLGATDEVVVRGIREGLQRLEDKPSDSSFAAWVAEAIAPRNVAGLADPARQNLYPVDFEPLVAGAGKLGLTPEEVRAALPRLRGT